MYYIDEICLQKLENHYMEVTTMSTFKKLVVLLLSAGMILAFTACGGSDSDSSSEEPAPAEEQ